MNAQLPPLPTKMVLGLRDDNYARLRTQYPNLATSLEECETCHGQKTLRWWNPERTEVVTYDCSCADQITARDYLLFSGIPEHLVDLNWSDLDLSIYGDRIAPLLEYLDERERRWRRGAIGKGLLLSGPPGVGKSTIAALVLKTYIAEQPRADGRFTTFLSLMDAFSAGWRNDEERAWFHRYVRRTGMLVIDDPGKEQSTRNDMATSTLDNMLRERVLDSMPIIFTSNDTPERFDQRYGQYVASMMIEAAVVVDLWGVPSQRGEGRADEREDRDKELGLQRPIIIEPPPTRRVTAAASADAASP